MSRIRITRYEEIYEKLEKAKEDIKQNMSEQEIKDFIIRQRTGNKNNELKNRLIGVPANVLECFEDTYSHGEELEGEVGIIEDEVDQYDGIITMSLLVLLSNRQKGIYKEKMEDIEYMERMGDTSLSSKMDGYRNKKRDALFNKDEALSELMAALYILDKTGDEYKDYFYYGNKVDDKGRARFFCNEYSFYRSDLCALWNRGKEKCRYKRCRKKGKIYY